MNNKIISLKKELDILSEIDYWEKKILNIQKKIKKLKGGRR